MINCQRLRREFQVDFQLSFSEGDGIGRNVNLMLAKVIIEKVSAPPRLLALRKKLYLQKFVIRYEPY